MIDRPGSVPTLAWLHAVTTDVRASTDRPGTVAAGVALAATIYLRASRDGRCWVGLRALEDATGVRRVTVVAYRRWWVARGWLTETLERRGGAVVYRLSMPSEVVAEGYHPEHDTGSRPPPLHVCTVVAEGHQSGSPPPPQVVADRHRGGGAGGGAGGSPPPPDPGSRDLDLSPSPAGAREGVAEGHHCADEWSRLANEIWTEQEQLRGELRAEGISPESRGLGLVPPAEMLGELKARIGERAMAIEQGNEIRGTAGAADDCRHVLRVLAEEARAKRTLRWLDGGHWSSKRFHAALTRSPGEARAGAKPARDIRVGRVEPRTHAEYAAAYREEVEF